MVTRAVLLMLATMLLAACSPTPNREDRMSSPPTTDQATTAEALLSGSGFTARPQPDSPPYQASVDGYDLSKATSVESTEDSLPPGDGRTRTVFRQVCIDHTDPANPMVHFWLFTT